MNINDFPDAKTIRAAVEKHGFMIVPEVLPSTTADSLIHQTEAFNARSTAGSVYGLRQPAQSFPAIKELTESATIRSLVEPVLGSSAFLARSIFFDKTPDANWKVAWHQDLTIAVREKIETPGFSAWSVKEGIVHVQPPVSILENMLAVRVHLDDCGSENGPLQVIPESHNAGRLDARQISEWRERIQPIHCIVPRAGVLLMRPLLLHASSSALRPGHRRVIHLEFAATPLPSGLMWMTF